VRGQGEKKRRDPEGRIKKSKGEKRLEEKTGTLPLLVEKFIGASKYGNTLKHGEERKSLVHDNAKGKNKKNLGPIA